MLRKWASVELLSGERLRPLGLMRVIGSGVDLQLAELLHTELVPRQHPLDGAADDLLGASLEKVAEGLLAVALREPAVPDVELGLALVAADGDPRGIEHDHVVARVEVRRPGRLVLALEDARDPRREAPERLVGRVDDEPAPIDLALSRRVGLRVHRSSCSPIGRSVRRPRTTRRRQSPLAGAAAPLRAGTRAARAAATSLSFIFPAPTSRRTATILRTIPRRKASALTSIVTSRPVLRTRTECTVRTGWRSAAP